MEQEPTNAPTAAAIAEAARSLGIDSIAADLDAKEAKKQAARQSNAERQARFRQRHQPAKLEARQADSLAALPEARRKELLALQDRFLRLHRDVCDTVQGITNGRTAGAPVGSGNEMLYPDLLFLEVKQFLVEYPPVECWVAKQMLPRLDANALERFDDRVLIEFGLQTRFLSAFADEFYRWCLVWCDANPNEADVDVHRELRALVSQHDNTPAPYVAPNTKRMSERERQGFVNAAQQNEAFEQRLAIEQDKFRLRQFGTDGANDSLQILRA